MNQAEKKKESYVGEPLVKLWLFALVSVTDIMSTEGNKYKNISVGETLAKLWLLSSVAPPLLDCLGGSKPALKKERARWGNPLQSSGCSLQLVVRSVLKVKL